MDRGKFTYNEDAAIKEGATQAQIDDAHELDQEEWHDMWDELDDQ